jgi:sugar/nucleoside kinase (ribokinase family)
MLDIRKMGALAVPAHRVLDTSGAGDVFHGAYVYSYLENPAKPWNEHFRFARAAAAHKIQHLGNEAGLPTPAEIAATRREFGDPP